MVHKALIIYFEIFEFFKDNGLQYELPSESRLHNLMLSRKKFKSKYNFCFCDVHIAVYYPRVTTIEICVKIFSNKQQII